MLILNMAKTKTPEHHNTVFGFWTDRISDGKNAPNNRSSAQSFCLWEEANQKKADIKGAKACFIKIKRTGYFDLWPMYSAGLKIYSWPLDQ